jgi:hypothetical protein
MNEFYDYKERMDRCKFRYEDKNELLTIALTVRLHALQ